MSSLLACLIYEVLMLQWRAWAQCLSLIFIGTLFSTAYYFLSKKYMALQQGLIPGNTPDPRVINWVECLVKAQFECKTLT